MQAFEIRDRFGLDALTLTDRPDPTPGPGQVRVKLRAWSLNYRDLLVVRGQYNPKMPLPRIPLSDGVGRIDAVGPGTTTDLRVGDRVAGLFMPGWVDGELTQAKGQTALGGAIDGLLADFAVLPASGVIPVPEHLTDEEAAALPCAAVTAWNALVTLGQLKAGETVLVQGTGGVSLFALQFAKLHGARVIATSGSDAKLQRALDLGADEGIHYKTTPEWGTRAQELTGGEGVDHVVEVGGPGTLPQSLKAVRPGGRISLIGVLTGPGAPFEIFPVLMKAIRLQGLYVGSGATFAAMNRAIALHRLRPVIDRAFPFDEARQALEYMEGQSHFGKIVIRR